LNVEVWEPFETAFKWIPLCALVGRWLFLMHGGLWHEMKSWTALRRPLDIPDLSMRCDLLGADPDPSVTGYADSPRGVSKVFGADVVRRFNCNMDLDLIVRGHQVPQDGY
jgi:diadenosine tetraphosphatase ApaH/serine/threonine PP2A family protein phosphatase